MSGGQKCRLVLAASIWTKPHLIALDEPTNYLDNETLNALTIALQKFKGAILVISHHPVREREGGREGGRDRWPSSSSVIAQFASPHCAFPK